MHKIAQFVVFILMGLCRFGWMTLDPVVLAEIVGSGVRVDRPGGGSFLFSGKPQLGVNGGLDLGEGNGHGLRKVGGTGLESVLVSDPVHHVGDAVGSDVGVAAAHHHNLKNLAGNLGMDMKNARETDH